MPSSHQCLECGGGDMGGFKLMSIPNTEWEKILSTLGNRLVCKSGECEGGRLMSTGQSTSSFSKNCTILQFYNPVWTCYETDHSKAVQWTPETVFEKLPELPKTVFQKVRQEVDGTDPIV